MQLPRIRALLPRLPRRRGSAHPVVSYDPDLDGRPDPGEVVWAWVPFQEDPAQGKDRPVLVIGRDGDELLSLPLTSKDHDRDAEQEASQGRFWMDVGRGTWDRQRRESEVNSNCTCIVTKNW